MNAKLLRCTLCAALLPLSGIVLVLTLRNYPTAIFLIVPVFTYLQIPMLMACRQTLQPFVRPEIKVLEQLNIGPVPAPYNPGRFRIDSRISSVSMWFGMAGPCLVWLSLLFPEEVSVLGLASYTAPSAELLCAGCLAVLIGVLSLPYWFQSTRAAVIYAEGSDRKRYLMRGFADLLEQKKVTTKAYERTCTGGRTFKMLQLELLKYL